MICVLKQVKRFRGPSVPFWVSVSLFGVLESPSCGQWQQPQAEHSGEPLGDPSARVFEVFLIVSQSDS